jgi:HAD superfamily hydrolase (TIGR01549 family)
MTRSNRAILFDLFGTLVRFDGRRLPVLDRPEGPVRSTVPAYASLLLDVVPGCSPAAFHGVLVDVSIEIAREQRDTRQEISSHQRFARALRAVGAAGNDLDAQARSLSAAHMRALAAAVYLPEGHRELLGRIGTRWATGLVSNFDHAPTARDILERTGLAPLLGAVVISDECGWRKPAPAIFQDALTRLGVLAADTGFVGDSYEDDVRGAIAAGLQPIWLQPGDATRTEDVPGVRRITDLRDLERVLED